MFVTIDPYYNISFYNECKEALKNNYIDFNSFISIKPPYDWYFQIDREPIMVNYDVIPKESERWLVSLVNPLTSQDNYLLLRRNDDNGLKALLKYIENEPMKQARLSDYAVLFSVKNKDELERLTMDFPGKIWFLGKYYNNKYRVCLATHRGIRGFLDDDQVLHEKSQKKIEPGRFEAEFNWKVLKNKDYLIKYTQTPYFQNGKYKAPKIMGEHSSRFIL